MSTIQGFLRADRRTKDLIKRLKPGDIALIHHTDLDSTAARSLVESRVAAVVNAVPSISGKYPNRGPSILIDAGIPLLDSVGEDFFDKASERRSVLAVIEGATVRFDGLCADGVAVTADSVAKELESARKNLGRALDHFARNTLQYLAEEKALLLDPVDVPDLDTQIRGRHAIVVTRGEGYKEDLHFIAHYLADVHPVLIGVDGGADALLELGLKPHIIIGDMDSVSDDALKCGAELVVHGYVQEDRGIPGLERIEKLGLSAKVFRAPATSEDIAMILADEKGASLIIAVGTHFSLQEFLDKGRDGMASTFLTRLRIGAKMVDAKGIGRLWARRNRPSTAAMLFVMLAALFPVAVVALMSPVFRNLLSTIRLWFHSTFGH